MSVQATDEMVGIDEELCQLEVECVSESIKFDARIAKAHAVRLPRRKAMEDHVRVLQQVLPSQLPDAADEFEAFALGRNKDERAGDSRPR